MSTEGGVEVTSGEHSAGRAGAVCATTGAALLVLGTYLHPMHADPNQPTAAFTEYARDSMWLASHLTQLCGMALLVEALLVLAHDLNATRPEQMSRTEAAELGGVSIEAHETTPDLPLASATSTHSSR